MKLAKIKNGDIECPHCKVLIITPVGKNPYNGLVEKQIVYPYSSSCPLCKKLFFLDNEQTMIHNHYHFPDDPHYMS